MRDGRRIGRIKRLHTKRTWHGIGSGGVQSGVIRGFSDAGKRAPRLAQSAPAAQGIQGAMCRNAVLQDPVDTRNPSGKDDWVSRIARYPSALPGAPKRAMFRSEERR